MYGESQNICGKGREAGVCRGERSQTRRRRHKLELLNKYRRSILDRLLSNIKVMEDDDCWMWTKYRNKDGYGMMRIGGSKGFVERVHRLSAFLFLGFSFGLEKNVVMHTCDNPGCVNPLHLRIATQKDNVIDMVVKGRNRALSGKEHPWYGRHHSEDTRRKIAKKLSGRPVNVGKANGMSLLTEEDVVEIRRLYSTGDYKQKELAVMFGVSRTTISSVVTYKAWKHVGNGND